MMYRCEARRGRLRLVEASEVCEGEIRDFIAAFPVGRMRATCDPDRIPGLDRFEAFGDVAAWLAFCESMAGRITWYLSIRESDGRVVGAVCLRHCLEYDDDDPEFASHIGYSIRPGERGRGYGAEQLKLVLGKARALGLDSVRIVCRDVNAASNAVIRANGGVFVDAIRGEESGMTVNRYDVPTLAL